MEETGKEWCMKQRGQEVTEEREEEEEDLGVWEESRRGNEVQLGSVEGVEEDQEGGQGDAEVEAEKEMLMIYKKNKMVFYKIISLIVMDFTNTHYKVDSF